MSLTKKKLIIALYLFCFCKGIIFGESIPSVEPIVITATKEMTALSKIPGSVHIINEDSIKLGKPTVSLGESLQLVPGLFSQNQTNFSQDIRLSIRGFGARSAWGIRGIKVFVDGLPETTADGHTQIDHLAIETIQSIEVFNGPLASLYGNASGGIIAIQTKSYQRPFLETHSTLGPWGLYKQSQTLAGSIHTTSYMLNLSRLTQDGWRDHSETRQTSYQGKITIPLQDDTQVQLLANGFDSPFAYDPGGLSLANAKQSPRLAWRSNISNNTGENITQHRFGATVSKHINSVVIDTYMYTLSRDFQNAIPGRTVEFERRINGAGVSVQTSLDYHKISHNLISGIDVAYQKDKRRNLSQHTDSSLPAILLNQHEKVNSLGIYIQDAIDVNRWHFTLGSRYDQLNFDVSDLDLDDGNQSGKNKFSELTHRIGFSKRITSFFQPYISMSQSFESPTFSELVDRSDNLDGINTQLKPQYSTNTECGLKGEHKFITYQLSVYDISLTNELVQQSRTVDNSELTYYVNSGKSSRSGLELSSQFKFSEQLKLITSFSYINATFDRFQLNEDSFEHKRVPGIPERTLFLNFTYTFQTGFFTSFDYHQANTIYLTNDNSEKVDHMLMSTLRFGQSFKYQSIYGNIYLGIRNLLDTTYYDNLRINAWGNRFYEVSPERNIYIGFKFGKTF